MSIMLGNLSVEQIEKRIGISFPAEIRDYMKQSHEPNASNIPEGKWHCFDIPFHIVCGDMITAQRIFDSVKDQSNQCKEPLQFSIQNQK